MTRAPSNSLEAMTAWIAEHESISMDQVDVEMMTTVKVTSSVTGVPVSDVAKEVLRLKTNASKGDTYGNDTSTEERQSRPGQS